MGILSSGGRATRALAGMGMATVLAATLMASPALADSRNVATYGVDLTAEQHEQVERFFGAGATDAEVIYVNNDQERAYLSAYIPLEQIGDKTYSCALVQPTTSGGIHVKTANLTYVTSDMIAATLATSGVSNCDVIAVCPFKVSGTGALTGVLMAYEQASGQTLDASKKDLANQELITTGTIAQTVGPDVATLIVNDVKAQVIQQNVTEVTDIDTIVNNVVNNIVNDYSSTVVDNSTTNVTVVEPTAPSSAADSADGSGKATPGAAGSSASDSAAEAAPAVRLSDEEMQALKDFAHALSEQGYSYDDMKETLEMVSKNASEAAGIADPMASGEAGAAATSSAADRDAASSSSAEADGTVAAGSRSDAGATPASEPLAQDSILTQTDDLALGEGAIVDSTDLSTIGDGVETRQQAEASAAAEASEAADSPAGDDPFASLTWDEATTGGAETAGQPASSAGAPGVAGESPSAGAATAGADAQGGAAAASVADAGAAAVSPLAGETIADSLGLPASAVGAGVTLTLERAMAATSLVEGTPDPLLVYEGADGSSGIMAADGTHLTEAAYAAGGIRGVGDGWVLATSAAGTTDVYLQTASETEGVAGTTATGVATDVASAASAANLTLVATIDGEVLQAQADGGDLNVQGADGTIAALDAGGLLAGVAPASVGDFSYATAPAGATAATEPATPGLSSVADVAPGAVAASPEAQAAPETAATAVPSALPANAQAVEGTDGALWLVPRASGGTTVCDAEGTDLLAAGFDAVQAQADGGWLLVTDSAAGESALYRVEVTPSA